MAKSPDDIRKNRGPAIDHAETVIDAVIDKETDTRRVTIFVKVLGGITMEDWAFVLAPKYLKAGWKSANWIPDQRDGDYIELQS